MSRARQGAVVREGAVGHEAVTVRMPLQEITGAGNGDDWPRVDSDLSFKVLAERLRAALRKVDQELSPPAGDASQQPRHGENDVSMRDGRKDPFSRRPVARATSRF